MSNEVITVDCSKELRFEGSQITGSVNLDTLLAPDKGVTAVKVSLKAQISTWIKYRKGRYTYKAESAEQLFKIEQTLWSIEVPVPNHPYATLNLPFSFVVPNDPNLPLPASLHCGNSEQGAIIQYYVHAVAEKKAWYKRNTRVNVPFPLLPLDRTSAPTLDLDNWSGPWNAWDKLISVRSNFLKLFGGSASVSATIELPKVESLPLHTRIPCRIYIICFSRPMPSSHSLDPTSFTFPRIPETSDIELELVQRNDIRAESQRRFSNQKYGLLGGFGTSDNVKSIQKVRTEPVWTQLEGDEHNKHNKGRWVETVTYSTYLTFNCPTPVNTVLIRNETKIHARITFPGLGNDWKTTVGPLAISSGVASAGQELNRSYDESFDLGLPPTYWDVIAEENAVLEEA